MYRRARVALVAVAILAAISACGTEGNSDSHATPATSPSGPFSKVDAETAALVTREATWQAPKSLDVGKTERIGLTVGEGATLKTKIEQLFPAALPTNAGPVLVGPTVRVSLHADPNDADITPSEAVDASTGSDVQMLWTWFVHPKHPNKALLLTARFDVPLSSGHTIHNEIALTLQVKRTVAYTAGQIFTHWGTWSAIAASIVSVAAWLWRRRRRISALLASGGSAQVTSVSPYADSASTSGE
jgi:hypothetical protein